MPTLKVNLIAEGLAIELSKSKGFQWEHEQKGWVLGKEHREEFYQHFNYVSHELENLIDSQHKLILNDSDKVVFDPGGIDLNTLKA